MPILISTGDGATVVKITPHFQRRVLQGEYAYVQNGIVWTAGTVQGGQFVPDKRWEDVDVTPLGKLVMPNGIINPQALEQWVRVKFGDVVYNRTV